jgi:hypothetical protein
VTLPIVTLMVMFALIGSVLTTAFAWWRASRAGIAFPGGPMRKLAASFVSFGTPMASQAVASAMWFGVVRASALAWPWWVLWIGLMLIASAAIQLVPPLRQLQRDYSAVTLSPRLRPKGSVTAEGGA